MEKFIKKLVWFVGGWIVVALVWAVMALFAVDAKAIEYKEFTLENGLHVVLVEDNRSPVVAHMVWYNVGSADETKGKTGIAHMLEHMMFKGTDDMPAGEFSKIVAREGGQDNAFTSRDYTAYYQKISSKKLEKMMEMEAGRMSRLNITDEHFQPERDVVMEERRLRVENKPLQRFFEKLLRTHYIKHPYGNPVIGWANDIKNYTLEDAREWYSNFYAPNNATLVIVGDVNHLEIEPKIRQIYGSVASKNTVKNTWEMEPDHNLPRRLEETDENVKVPVFYRLYRAPSEFTGLKVNGEDTKDALAIALMAQIFGGGSTSPFYENLVKSEKLASAASIDYSRISKGESMIDIFVQPMPDISLEVIEKRVDELLQEFIENSVNSDDLERAKTQFLASDIYAMDSPFYTAMRIGRWVTSGGKMSDFDNWQKELNSITPAEISRVAKEYFNINQSTTGWLQPKNIKQGN